MCYRLSLSYLCSDLLKDCVDSLKKNKTLQKSFQPGKHNKGIFSHYKQPLLWTPPVLNAHNAKNVGWDIPKQAVGHICCPVAHFLLPDLALEELPTLLSAMCFA